MIISLILFLAHFISYWISSLIYFIIDYKNGRYHSIRNEYNNTIKRVLSNQIFLGLPLSLLYAYCNVSVGIYFVMKSIIDIILMLGIYEIIFYYVHRLFHNRYLYKYVHSTHHHWINPIGVSALDAHPLEVILIMYMPSLIGAYITTPHIYSVIIYMTLGGFNAVKAHSGYNWYILSSRGHELHHIKKNVNFGGSTILDYIHGTYSSK